MSMETCTEHDDVVIVYDGHGNYRSPCPLCEAESQIKTMEDKAEEAEATIADLKMELKEAQESQGS
jgi:hypothetical protein